MNNKIKPPAIIYIVFLSCVDNEVVVVVDITVAGVVEVGVIVIPYVII